MQGDTGRDTGRAAALRAAVEGEVAFDGGRRAEYSSDASLYRCVPLGVVFPRSADDPQPAAGRLRRPKCFLGVHAAWLSSSTIAGR